MKRLRFKQNNDKSALHFRPSRSISTFSYCLTKAWTEAKEEARISEENARRAAEYKAKYGNRDYRNYRSYYSSRMGHNDWRCDYRNDAKATVIRSFNAR